MAAQPPVFDTSQARNFDRNFSKLAQMKDVLHFLIGLVLGDLAKDARILCVGAGTGAELIALAEMFPRWQFTLVEPAAAMMQKCRQAAEKAGISPRCTFHQGYLETLPGTEQFDAATSILVSQFCLDSIARGSFFREIAQRLRPDGYLINADLAADMSSPQFKNLLEVWMQMLGHSGMTSEKIENMRSGFGKNMSVLPPEAVETLIFSNGFTAPVLFCQTLFIHAWYAKVDNQAQQLGLSAPATR